MRSLRALNLIGGEWQQAAGAREGDSINPANGREVGTYSAGGAADARQAIDEAQRAFERGGLSPNPRQRAVVLLRWADRLAKRHDLAYLLTLENGKVLAQSQHEISTAIACLRHHACALMKAADGATASTASQPAGVVAILVSWNAPVASLVASLAPALAAGCCAVVKPARQSVQVVAALVRELGAVEGLPSGVVNLVSEAGQEVTRELVASSGVDIVCFSGSQEAGRKMAQAVAPGAKRLLFDLARKSCSLVFPDIDVQVVAGQLAAAGLVAAGQHSSAPRCILVHVSCFDQAKLALKRALEQVTVGAGDSAGCGLGPLIDAAALVAVGVRTEQALARCDEVVLHGRRAGGELADGYFLLPTLVAERDCAAMSSHEEIYGPFISIVPFQDDRDALARANAVPMARSVSIWTGDAGRVRRLARELNNDSIHVNRHGWLAPGGGSMHPGHAARGGLSDFLVAPGNDAIALE